MVEYVSILRRKARKAIARESAGMLPSISRTTEPADTKAIPRLYEGGNRTSVSTARVNNALVVTQSLRRTATRALLVSAVAASASSPAACALAIAAVKAAAASAGRPVVP